MTRRVTNLLAALVALVLLGASCSGSDEPAIADGSATSASCAESAQQVVDRFDQFLEPFNETTPEDFLASSELDGLSDFQNDVAETIVRVATDPNDDCTEQDLESEVELALDNYAGEGTLNQYLVGLVRQGAQVKPRDIAIGPDDDLVAILGTLGPGSSITFAAGTYTLDASILVQGDLVLVGAGQGETIVESSADTAAIAVLGGGSVVMNDFTIRHIGDIASSVVVVVDASLELVNMTISGGVVDEAGGGGSGVVLTETENAASDPVVAIDQSTISNNAAAGIAVTGSYAPRVLNSVIESNGQCGICFFDSASGQTQSTLIRDNSVGIQVSNQALPELALNTFEDNLVAGLLIDGESTPTVLENRFEAIDIVGIDVQDSAAPVMQRNVIEGHAVGISLRGTSTASVSQSAIEGADVGLLVGGSATPVVFENLINRSQIAGILHTETSMGEFTSNKVAPEDGAGMVSEGQASPVHTDTTIEGGLVGVVFREESAGRFTGSTVTDQQVGLEVNDQASPLIESNMIIGSLEAGMILGGDNTATVQDNLIEGHLAIGIQAGGTTTAQVEANTVNGGDTAILVTDESAPTIIDNSLSDQNFAVGVSGSAQPVIENNEIRNAAAGAMSFEGESAGQVLNNTITDAGVVGVRIAGQASPTLEGNSLFALVQAPGAGNELSGEAAADEAAEAAADAQAVADDAQAVADEARAAVELAQAAVDEAVAEDDEDAIEEAEATLADAMAEADDAPAELEEAQAAADEAAAVAAEDGGTGGANGSLASTESGAGLLYAEGGSGLAHDNQIFGFVIGIQVSDQATPDLTENTVDGAGVGGVGILYGIEGAGTADGNFSIGQQLGFQLSGTTQPTLTNNTVRGAEAAAFLIQGDSAPVVTSNECEGNAAGIVVLENAAPELDQNNCSVR